MSSGPIILHGARVYPRVSRRHGIKHTASIKPLDRNRSRPCGWWMHDETTGLRHGIVETLRGRVLNLDGLELDELVQRTQEAHR
ncbi:MAG: hypothetical protein JWN10_1671 [Solirubrobacterales bacterium]|nr:hypothetical protein [Solirubrobacterales bacterium]